MEEKDEMESSAKEDYRGSFEISCIHCQINSYSCPFILVTSVWNCCSYIFTRVLILVLVTEQLSANTTDKEGLL